MRAHKHCTAVSDWDTLCLSNSTEQRPPHLLSNDWISFIQNMAFCSE